LEDVKAVGPDGNSDKYSDYYDESLRLLRLFLEVMNEPDGSSKPLTPPHLCFSKLRKRSLVTDNASACLRVAYKLAERWGSVYFVNQMLPWQHSNVFYNSDLSRIDSEWKDWESGTMRVGSLDNITLNLPRIAYDGKRGRR